MILFLATTVTTNTSDRPNVSLVQFERASKSGFLLEKGKFKTTQFAYNGIYYQQVFGTAMGSPVSVVIANMVMEDVEQRALATSPVKPFFWKRYVDDVIFAVSGNEAERLLSHLNSVEPSIQFTLEREKDRHLPFLDLNVSRGVQGNLETSVYCKPAHTDKYLAFEPSRTRDLMGRTIAQHVRVYLCPFLSFPLQNKNVKSPKCALSENGNRDRKLLELNVSHKHFAEVEV